MPFSTGAISLPMLVPCVDHPLPTMSTSDGSASISSVRFQYSLINGLRDAGLARRTRTSPSGAGAAKRHPEDFLFFAAEQLCRG